MTFDEAVAAVEAAYRLDGGESADEVSEEVALAAVPGARRWRARDRFAVLIREHVARKMLMEIDEVELCLGNEKLTVGDTITFSNALDAKNAYGTWQVVTVKPGNATIKKV